MLRVLLASIALLTACGSTEPPPPEVADGTPPRLTTRQLPPEAEEDAPPTLAERVAAMASHQQWAWVVSSVPALADLDPVAIDPDLSSFGTSRRTTLYAFHPRALGLARRPGRCLELPFEVRDDGSFRTRVDRRGRRAGPDLRGDARTLEVGATVTLRDAPRPDAESEEGGTDDDEVAALARLSDIGDASITYGRRDVYVTVTCEMEDFEHTCPDGESGTCWRCDLQVQIHGVDEFPGLGIRGSNAVPPPCGCPPDRDSERLEALQSVLAERVAYQEIADPIVFYREREACEAARRSWEPPAEDDDGDG